MTKWTDKMGHRSRNAWLLLIHRDSIVVFRGKSIPGVVAVVDTRYEKNGKWSGSEYDLELAPGVRAIPGNDGWESGSFREGLRTATGLPTSRWTELATALGVSLDSAQAWLREWRSKAAEHYDSVEVALATIDDVAPTGADEVTVSFGSPTRRSREEGFWGWPLVVSDADGATVAQLTPQQYETVGSHGPASVLECRKSSGHGGGYVSVRLAVPSGYTVEHRAP